MSWLCVLCFLLYSCFKKQLSIPETWEPFLTFHFFLLFFLCNKGIWVVIDTLKWAIFKVFVSIWTAMLKNYKYLCSLFNIQMNISSNLLVYCGFWISFLYQNSGSSICIYVTQSSMSCNVCFWVNSFEYISCSMRLWVDSNEQFCWFCQSPNKIVIVKYYIHIYVYICKYIFLYHLFMYFMQMHCLIFMHSSTSYILAEEKDNCTW